MYVYTNKEIQKIVCMHNYYHSYEYKHVFFYFINVPTNWKIRN